MSVIIPYNRLRAVEYAKKYAKKRDENFFDFELFGGNCTAFISQCLYFANKIMNPQRFFGWYYYSSYNRSPSWTSVELFYNFLISNTTLGPFAKQCEVQKLELGDIVQLKFYGHEYFTHSLLVTKIFDNRFGQREKDIFVSANSFDVLNKKLTDYNYKEARFLKVLGVYTYIY